MTKYDYTTSSYLFILVFSLSLTAFTVEKSYTLNLVTKNITHADTYYRLGMSEQGNMDVYGKGIAHLYTATKILGLAKLDLEVERSLLELIKEISESPYFKAKYVNHAHDSTEYNVSKITVAEQKKNLLLISALFQDINEQADISHDKFYGVFPLVRLLRPSLFQDQSANRSYELVDDPGIIAGTSAARNLVDSILNRWGLIPQFDVIFLSQPNSPQLENEILSEFCTSPKFFVHSYKELVDILSIGDLAVLKNGQLKPSILEKIFCSF